MKPMASCLSPWSTWTVKTLDRAIARQGLPLAEALKYALPMANALAKAHAAGIIHRDFKPSNIMITAERHGEGAGFRPGKADGRRRFRDSCRPRTLEGTVLGTAAYMSPEQAEGKAVDARSDIFSFGAVLYEMLTGKRAFGGESRMATISAGAARRAQAAQSRSARACPGNWSGSWRAACARIPAAASSIWKTCGSRWRK